MRAILLTDGNLNNVHGKTAHGLITGSSRFPVQAVIDPLQTGKDAGEVIDGKTRHIPVFTSVHDAITKLTPKPTHCIVGVATHGGFFTPTLQAELQSAIENQLCIVNGLHELVCEHPVLNPLVAKYQSTVIDIRKPKPLTELHAWSGKIYQIPTPRIAILGTDCAIGKRTTTHLLQKLCEANDIHSQMIYTGQTGWLQGYEYGFIFDSTLNDFVSGELEHAIVSCAQEVNPDLILLEGQSALRNPSGPCGAEFIVSGGAKGVILHHAVGRKYFNHGDEVHCPLPPLAEEIALIKLYGADVLAITLNTGDLVAESWHEAKMRIARETGLPVICPKEEGVAALLPVIQSYIKKES